MATTFSGAVSPTAPAVYATLPAQSTGAMDTGIGIKGADGAALPANATGIGGVPITAKFDTDGNPATP